jgi:hypothetical protein
VLVHHACGACWSWTGSACRFKEEEINQSSKFLLQAVEYLAEQQGRKPDDVMEELMHNPVKMLPALFSANNMREWLPDNLKSVRC